MIDNRARYSHLDHWTERINENKEIRDPYLKEKEIIS